MTGIANQYALAVFSLAKEENREEDFVLLLEKISNEISEDSLKFFAHPKISKAEKREFLSIVIEDKLLLNFLKVLVDNDRISLLKAITLAYKDILDDINKTMVVKVISNGPLTKSNLERISKKLSATYNRKIKIIEEADKTIIGGFRLEFEGNILDETINKQLEDLKTSLVE